MIGNVTSGRGGDQKVVNFECLGGEDLGDALKPDYALAATPIIVRNASHLLKLDVPVERLALLLTFVIREGEHVVMRDDLFQVLFILQD